MEPVRIQRKRTKGWKMPPNTVDVTRPGRWGNPFVVGEPVDKAQAKRWGWWPLGFPDFVARDAETAVSRFGVCLAKDQAIHAYVRAELKGKNLACWCPLDQPCHADILLELANSNGGSDG